MASWEQLGEVANVAQLTGLDAVRLIGMIAKAATTARMHKKNCRQFSQHLKLIGNLLEQLKISELKKYPETREPLEQLEDALRRSYILVNNCRDRSYLYLLAMGWSIVYQFRKAQGEIDRYLKIVPLITLVDNARFKERLDDIERDQREYTLDEEDEKVQDMILKPDSSKNNTSVLKKTLSCSYPNLAFEEALQKENVKLQKELERSQVNMDIRECEVIQHLIGVTEAAANTLPEKNCYLKNSNKLEHSYSDDGNDKGHPFDGGYLRQHSDLHTPSKNASPISSGHDLISTRGSYRHEEWRADLLGCCSEPYLSLVSHHLLKVYHVPCLHKGLKTFFYPCGTFSKIAMVASEGQISPEEACNDLMRYSLLLACCCYTCCVRRKLRRMLNITGGLCDDFLSHLMCCCCALVQEWREVEIRGVYVAGPQKTRTSPPPSQFMES